MTLPVRRWLAPVAATALVLGACSQSADLPLSPRLTPDAPARAAAALPSVRIAEFHYDNTGTDVNESVEISGPAGTSLAGWQLVLYNGTATSRLPYTTTSLTQTIPTTCGTRGVVVINYPSNGIQNGASTATGTDPDGMALVDPSGNVVDLLAYEGSFVGAGTAPASPAAGLTFPDIGVREVGTESASPVTSLKRDGNGAWSGPTPNNFGACNDDVSTQPATVETVSVSPSTATVTVGATTTLTASAADANGQPVGGVTFTWASSNTDAATVDASGVVKGVAAGSATITATAPNGKFGSATVTVNAAPGSASNVRVSEFHYDNVGTDADEQIEIEGDVGGSVNGWSLVLYSGTPGSATIGQSYSTVAVSGTFAACTAGGARGVLVFATPGLQNGDADGFALVNASGQVVEFLSYEGSFQATNGPAAGMTSTDVGVSEANAPPVGRSLQRAGNGTWFGPSTSTFGQCNPATPPAPQTGITFTGRLPSDPALPIGFQDQLFATLRDANTGATVPTTFTWTSETPSIMTVDDRGVITARGLGTGIIRATAADGTTSTISLATETPVFGDASLYKNPLAFGAPTDATPGDEFRITRNQYVLSYNKTTHTPNWVAEHLDRANRGDLPGYRCDCFSIDPLAVDASDPGISTADYTGSGFDRGHMVRSNDRELAHGDQATTYYTTNIVPQYANLNQGRWADLESYLQSVEEGPGSPEVYIFSGARGNAGTIANGRIVVPTHTWKVAVVLPAGMSPSSITQTSDILDVIAVDMPNVSDLPRDGNWQAHRVTVDAIQKATGYDLLSALPESVECKIEVRDCLPETTLATTTPNAAAGQTFNLQVRFRDADASDAPWKIVINWGDGTAPFTTTSLLQTWNTPLTRGHVYSAAGSYTITVTITDKQGGATTTQLPLTIL